jgi:hypothetical protein
MSTDKPSRIINTNWRIIIGAYFPGSQALQANEEDSLEYFCYIKEQSLLASRIGGTGENEPNKIEEEDNSR